MLMTITTSISRGDNGSISEKGAPALKAQEKTKTRRFTHNKELQRA